MIPNINEKTGIPYGVVPLNSLSDWVFDEFMTHGTNVSFKEALSEYVNENPEDPDGDDFHYDSELDTYIMDREGMRLQLAGFGGAYLVTVLESPHITEKARQCSPCIPNAGDLNSEGGYMCYTLPSEWFGETA